MQESEVQAIFVPFAASLCGFAVLGGVLMNPCDYFMPHFGGLRMAAGDHRIIDFAQGCDDNSHRTELTQQTPSSEAEACGSGSGCTS